MSRMLVKTYVEVTENPNKYKLQEEIFGSLSELEKNLSRTMLLINIIGDIAIPILFHFQVHFNAHFFYFLLSLHHEAM